MMSDYLRAKIMRKNKADFRALNQMLEEKKPITILALQEKFGFSPSRAATAIQNAHLCGILAPQG
jgi:predicted transcriptional regulator